MNQLNVSLWRDEAYSVILAKHGLWDIVTLTSRDTAPPLYHFILHFWMIIVGSSEVALRSLSLLTFALLIVAVYFFAKEVFKSNKAGITAAVLTLVNPLIVMYAFEARMYMLLMLFTVLSMWFFLTKRWVLYICSTLAALYTHNFAIFIPIIQVLSYSFGLLSSENFRKEKNLLKLAKNQLKSPFIKSLLVVLIFFLPWIPVLYNQTFKFSDTFWIAKPDFSTLLELFLSFMRGLDKFPGIRLVEIMAIALLILRGLKRNRDENLYFWLLLPALITFALSQFLRPIFFYRYLVISAPAIPLLLASQMKNNLLSVYLAKIKYVGKIIKKIQFSTILLLIMMILLLLADVNSFNNPTKSPFRELANYVKNTYGEKQEVINYYNNVLHYFELKYYGLNVKVYANGPIPFWNGTTVVAKNDILKNIPSDKKMLVMASGNVDVINIPSYKEVSKKQFGDLYLLWFIKEDNAKN